MTACQTIPTSEIVQNKNDGKLQEKIKQQMLREGLWTDPENDDIIARRITIDRIDLGMMRVREKDTYDGLIMVPTWNLYGYETETFAEDSIYAEEYALNENNEYVNDQIPGHSFLTVNAIDGSVINPIFEKKEKANGSSFKNYRLLRGLY